MNPRIVVAPAAYPVTLEEAKIWCRIDETDTSEDALVTSLIGAITNRAEQLTGRAFIERTLELNLDCFERCIELPWAPLLGVDSVKYTDLDGNEQTVAPTDYEVDTVNEPGLVRPYWNKFWPVHGPFVNPIRIQYRAGYAYPGSPTDLTDNSYLPQELRAWMQARICTLYDNREQIVVGATVAEIPRDFCDALLDGLTLGTRFF